MMPEAKKRNAYREEMEARLARLTDDVEALQARARNDASRDYSDELETLEYQYQKFYARLDQLEAVEPEEWDEWQTEIDEIAAKLQRTVEQLDRQLPEG